MLSVIDLISAVGAAQGVFLALLLASQKERSLPNRILAAFIIAFTLLTIGDILYYSHLLLYFPHLWLVFDPLTFVLAPLFYLYVLSLVQPGFTLQVRHLAHGIPAFLLYAVFAMVYVQPADAKLAMLRDEYSQSGSSVDIALLVAAAQMLVYLAAAFVRLRRHSALIRDNYSFREKVELRWLRVMIGVMAVLWMCFVITTLFNLPVMRALDRVMFPAAVYIIGYMGIRQPAIFRRDSPMYTPIAQVAGQPIVESLPEDIPPVPTAERKKYDHSTLTPDAAAVYAERLREAMESEKLYLRADLKLQDVALQLDARPHHLSQVLNDNLGKSFFDFVNGYRVEEVKRKLHDPAFDNFTLLAIGLESGFNSKAAFNAAFRKHTGTTPSQYKRTAGVQPDTKHPPKSG